MTPYLPPDEPRCRPGCADQGATCGRLHAPLPAAGATIVDGTKQWPRMWPSQRCAGYVPISGCTVPAAPVRRVHKPFGAE